MPGSWALGPVPWALGWCWYLGETAIGWTLIALGSLGTTRGPSPRPHGQAHSSPHPARKADTQGTRLAPRLHAWRWRRVQAQDMHQGSRQPRRPQARHTEAEGGHVGHSLSKSEPHSSFTLTLTLTVPGHHSCSRSLPYSYLLASSRHLAAPSIPSLLSTIIHPHSPLHPILFFTGHSSCPLTISSSVPAPLRFRSTHIPAAAANRTASTPPRFRRTPQPRLTVTIRSSTVTHSLDPPLTIDFVPTPSIPASTTNRPRRQRIGLHPRHRAFNPSLSLI